MITNQVLRGKLDESLTKLDEAYDSLYQAWNEADNIGIKVDICKVQIIVKNAKAAVEDIIYGHEPELDVYELVTDDKVIRLSEVNSL